MKHGGKDPYGMTSKWDIDIQCHFAA